MKTLDKDEKFGVQPMMPPDPIGKMFSIRQYYTNEVYDPNMGSSDMGSSDKCGCPCHNPEPGVRIMHCVPCC